LESRDFDCHLYHAAQVKALPGRPKTDRADSIWLAKIVERGMIAASFVPPAPIRALRTHTRYRRHLTQARTAEKQRVEKLLEDAHLKLSAVISDIHGVSGRAMLEAIIAGNRNPRALAHPARGSMRGKIRRLEEALDCSFLTEAHVAILAMMLAAIDHYTAQIDQLTRQDRGAGRALPAPDRATRRRARHRPHQRPRRDRRNRRGHDHLPHRRPPGLLGPVVPPGPPVRRQA
jgi:transposase